MPLILDLRTIGNTPPGETGRSAHTPSPGFSKSMSNLETLIQTCIELGSAKTMETLGAYSGEISQGRTRQMQHGVEINQIFIQS